MSNRGGKRQGAGRKEGALDKLPRKRLTTENSSAQTRTILKKHSPLDVMILTMNGYISAADILGQNILKVDERIITQLELLHKASAIAKDAAPYVHPRLANIEHSGKDGQPIKHHVTISFVESPIQEHHKA